ncbi:hypothetical protein Glove_120g180 [Diversispora epigaea]|uniref:Uncharacterized protein n=1 Tax=Diversispora epigaea TaxID=1348612 RepID=A0A397J369_9GLOM|nr:hypothetical protein Glove_120g180 [Diversispora epigaea]
MLLFMPSHTDIDKRLKKHEFSVTKKKSYQELSAKVEIEINKENQNSLLVCYERGRRNNFHSIVHRKDFGVDAAFCMLTNTNRTSSKKILSLPKVPQKSKTS